MFVRHIVGTQKIFIPRLCLSCSSLRAFQQRSWLRNIPPVLQTECFRRPKIRVLKPTPQSDGIQIWGFWKEMRSWGRSHMNGIRVLIKETSEVFFAPSGMGNAGRRQPSTNLEVGPLQTPNLPAPWPWTSHPPELWEIDLCCLSHPLCAIFMIGARTD